MLLKRLFHTDDRKSSSGLRERRLTGKPFGKAKGNKGGAFLPSPLEWSVQNGTTLAIKVRGNSCVHLQKLILESVGLISLPVFQNDVIPVEADDRVNRTLLIDLPIEVL